MQRGGKKRGEREMMEWFDGEGQTNRCGVKSECRGKKRERMEKQVFGDCDVMKGERYSSRKTNDHIVESCSFFLLFSRHWLPGKRNPTVCSDFLSCCL